ncbi:hypothetical protein ABIE44_001524 [Marmoricola sp. OAE513]|uniref:hypothetical protein n=1 Tax=Marmoricola sp. OAE513 TaxID=2817894 RepID=UPI001AE8B916
MTAERIGGPPPPHPGTRRRHLRLVRPVEEAPDRCPGVRVEATCDYRLRLVECEDGIQVSRFECDACGAVLYR